MGTNYYLETKETPWGETPRLHIGKSAVGWVFLFRVHEFDDKSISTTLGWRDLIDKCTRYDEDCWIADEYGTIMTVEDFWAFVNAKQKPWGPNKEQPQASGDYIDNGNAFARYEFSHEGRQVKKWDVVITIETPDTDNHDTVRDWVESVLEDEGIKPENIQVWRAGTRAL